MDYEAIRALYPIAAAFVGLVVWSIRLEGKVKANEKANEQTQRDVDALRTKHEALDSKVIEELTRIREALARIEGRLSVETRE